jgi:histidine triad (HIT) family protein
MDDCIFCKIVRGEIPAKLVAETEHAVAFDDLHPSAPVHVLVIPKNHVAALADISMADSDALAHCMLLAVEAAAIKGVHETGFRVTTNSGPDSGQEIPHLHFHVLGGERLRKGVN